MSQLVWPVVRFVLAFALVVALAAGVSRWLGAQARGGRPGMFRLLGGLSLGGPRQICAVRVGGRVLLLGLGDKQVHLLESITDPDEVAALTATAAPAPALRPGAFAAALARALGRGDGAEPARRGSGDAS